MKDRTLRSAEFVPQSQLEAELDLEGFTLHIHYVRAHGYPQGPLSTLKPDHRMQIASNVRGVPLE